MKWTGEIGILIPRPRRTTMNTIALHTIVFVILRNSDMFRTNAIAQAPSLHSEGRDGDRFWFFVEVMFRNNWFIASFTVPSASDNAVHTAILADLSQVTRLIDERGVELKQVVLVTPPNINGSDRWQFDELVEAWDCDTDLAPNCPVQVYVVASGREYADSFLETKAASLRRMRRVYPRSQVTTVLADYSLNRH